MTGSLFFSCVSAPLWEDFRVGEEFARRFLPFRALVDKISPFSSFRMAFLPKSGGCRSTALLAFRVFGGGGFLFLLPDKEGFPLPL